VNVSNPNGRITTTNSTIAFNSAAGQGGGLDLDPKGIGIIRNTIISNNTSNTGTPNVSGSVVSEGYNLVSAIAGSTGWSQLDLLDVDGMLAPMGNNGGATWTHAILPDSPAINAGNNKLARDPYNNSLLVSDQRGKGFARVVDETVDIGAYEANFAIVPVTVGGRAATLGGRGIPNVRITLTSGGTTRYAQTNPFGYYRFVDLMPGTTYEVAIMHKYYLFATPQYFTADQNRSDLNFTAR
jgi:hypothetical protein